MVIMRLQGSRVHYGRRGEAAFMRVCVEGVKGATEPSVDTFRFYCIIEQAGEYDDSALWKENKKGRILLPLLLQVSFACI
jgi:hypothetical protein